MGYAMSSKSVISQPSIELYEMHYGDDDDWDLGLAADKNIFQTYIDVSKLDITAILVLEKGKKNTDTGADNHMKLTVDGNLAIDTVYTNDSYAETFSSYALSTDNVTGFVPIKYRYDTGGDDKQLMKYIKIWAYRGS